jgi:hypothetical protein
MDENAQRYFTELDASLSPKELAKQIETTANWLCYDPEGVHPLAETDRSLLRIWAKEAHPLVRVAAIKALVTLGNVEWDDISHWAIDADKDVRITAIDQADRTVESRERFIHLLLAVMECHTDFYAGIELHMLIAHDDAMLERVWPELERLLVKNDPALNSLLLCCLFEHIIPQKGWGPDDPHIAHWITGDFHTRQAMLLAIAEREGIDAKRFREIVKALTRSSIPQVATEARAMLSKKAAAPRKGKHHQKR